MEPVHHPFCKPINEEFSEQFDLVINGYEVLGGSERIDDVKLQQKILEISQQKINLPFFNFSVPNHTGCAFGIDRLLSAIFDTTSIRDWIAFPKTGQGNCTTFLIEE